MVTLFSWNVNGIRAVLNKGFLDFVDEYSPDILCIQETKAQIAQVQEVLSLDMQSKGYMYEGINEAEKKGYSGVAIFSKIKPLNITYGIKGLELSNEEGRVVTFEFSTYYLICVYTPNSKRDLSRLEFRYTTWDSQFLAYCTTLEKKKPVIFCGDLNAAHKEIDVKNDASNKTTAKNPGNAGFTDKEREGISTIISHNFIDSFRHFNPNEEKFSWWSYMGGARAKNVGWRIDYFFVSQALKNNLVNAQIHDNVMGSDHCPISIDIKL